MGRSCTRWHADCVWNAGLIPNHGLFGTKAHNLWNAGGVADAGAGERKWHVDVRRAIWWPPGSLRRSAWWHHTRPFVGVFQKSIIGRFVNSWRLSPAKWLRNRPQIPKQSPGITPRRAFGGGPASFWAKQRSASGQHRKRSSKGAGTRAGGVADAGAGAPDLQRLQHRALCLSLSLPLSIFLSRSLTHTHAHPHPRVYAWMTGTAPTLPSPPLSHPRSLRGMQVISPTRELALQTFNFFKTYSKFTDLTGEQVH